MQQLTQEIQKGTRISFVDYDIHTIAALVKKFVRDLPHPLFPAEVKLV